MLTAGAARPVCIDTQIVGIDIHLDLVVDFRIDVHSSERSVPPVIRVERRYPHEPVDAALRLEPAESELAFYLERSVFYPGL